MRRTSPARIAVIGAGFIGRGLIERIGGDPTLGLEVAFVAARDPRRTSGSRMGPEWVLTRREDVQAALERHAPALVVEAAHPDVTRELGATILRAADYLPLSVTALADDDLRARLERVATEHGHRLLLPRGALVGADSLAEWRDHWTAVSITFRKPPTSIDFSVSGIDPPTEARATVLYDGPVRGIAALFPRNVNTMVTCALVTVGLDACRGVLVAEPSLDHAVAEVHAVGRDGSELRTARVQPVAGVSGTEMAASALRSVLMAVGRPPAPGLV